MTGTLFFVNLTTLPAIVRQWGVMMAKKSKPKTVELVRSGYQPTKAEMEKEFKLRKADGSQPSVEDIAQAVFQKPNPRWVDRPRRQK